MEDIIKKDGDSYDVNGYEYFDKEEVKAEIENAKLLYKPEFIPFYLKEIKEYGFNNTEGLVYGFMRFYLSNNPRGQFYFTNEQLAYMLDVSPRTITRAISRVLDCGEFEATYRVKADGGTFRLVKNVQSRKEILQLEKDYQSDRLDKNTNRLDKGVQSDWTKPTSLTRQNCLPNKNKVKENKINISKDMDKSSYGNKDIKDLKEFLIKNYPKALDGITDNRKLWNLRQVCIPRKNSDEWMNEKWKKNFADFLVLYLRETEEEYLVGSVDKLKEKVKLWREYRGKLN